MLFKCQVLDKDNTVNLTPAANPARLSSFVGAIHSLSCPSRSMYAAQEKFSKNNPMQSSVVEAQTRTTEIIE
jgi:hypothetical protein